MGGKPPSDLLIPKSKMEELANDPFGFMLAVALPPDHSFSPDEVKKMEEKASGSAALDRSVKGPVVIWTGRHERGESVWAGGKPLESMIPPSNTTYILGGLNSFWPLPLQRHGLFTTVMWKTTLPEDLTSSWLDYLGKAVSKELKGVFWTLSKRYDLYPASSTTLC